MCIFREENKQTLRHISHTGAQTLNQHKQLESCFVCLFVCLYFSTRSVGVLEQIIKIQIYGCRLLITVWLSFCTSHMLAFATNNLGYSLKQNMLRQLQFFKAKQNIKRIESRIVLHGSVLCELPQSHTTEHMSHVKCHTNSWSGSQSTLSCDGGKEKSGAAEKAGFELWIIFKYLPFNCKWSCCMHVCMDVQYACGDVSCTSLQTFSFALRTCCVFVHARSFEGTNLVSLPSITYIFFDYRGCLLASTISLIP